MRIKNYKKSSVIRNGKEKEKSKEKENKEKNKKEEKEKVSLIFSRGHRFSMLSMKDILSFIFFLLIFAVLN